MFALEVICRINVIFDETRRDFQMDRKLGIDCRSLMKMLIVQETNRRQGILCAVLRGRRGFGPFDLMGILRYV